MNEITTLEDIDIPDNVFVPCPRGGRWDNERVSTTCLACEHFCGLYAIGKAGDMGKIASLPFIGRFRVNCAHPVSREMLEVKL